MNQSQARAMPAAGGKTPMKGGMALSSEDREWGEAKDSNPAHSTACSAISGLFVEVSKDCPSDVRSRQMGSGRCGRMVGDLAACSC